MGRGVVWCGSPCSTMLINYYDKTKCAPNLSFIWSYMYHWPRQMKKKEKNKKQKNKNKNNKQTSNIHKMRSFRSSCACAKYHPGVCSPFIHSIVSNDSVNERGRPWSDCADAHADLGLRCPHMPEDTFSHGVDDKASFLTRTLFVFYLKLLVSWAQYKAKLS